MVIEDREVASRLLGCVIKNPDILANEQYKIKQEDFPHHIHNIIFTAVHNLYGQGVTEPSVADIVGLISNYGGVFEIFEENKGAEVITQAVEHAELQNLNYYYNRTKKMTLLRKLDANNFDISYWYSTDLLDIGELAEKTKRLEDATIEEIVNSYQTTLMELEGEFINKSNFFFESAGEGLGDLLEELRTTPEHGFKIEGNLMNTVAKGGRPSKVYLVSAPSGVGKSRLLLANAAKMAIPFQYQWGVGGAPGKWIQTGGSHKVLYITTELEVEEVQTMLLANISGINEDNILNGGVYLSPLQWQVLKEAIEIIEFYKENLYVYHMPDPNIKQMNNNVRRMVMTQGFEAVVFDYIHVSPTLISEFGSARIREDSALLMMSTALKNLANELDVFIYTATQVNASAQQSTREEDAEFGSEAMVRGARSIADKVDLGFIMRRVTDPLRTKVQTISEEYGIEPNLYMDVYKNRRGKHTQIRLWVHADLGTCRFYEAFVTDPYNNHQPIEHLLDIQEEVDETVEEILKK